MRVYICKHRGCTKYAVPDSDYCTDHQSDATVDWSLRESHFNYQDPEWRRLSRELLKERPVCERCGLEKSTEVHHVTAIRDGGDPYDESNLICLCHHCHLSVTASEGAKRREKSASEERIRELMKRYNLTRLEAEEML